MSRFLGWIDERQQRWPITAFPFGVVKKFGDDRAGRLAALVAYYAFFSLFPLLLVVVTVVAFVLDDRTAQDLENSAIAQIPVVGDQIGKQVGGLSGSTVALVVGTLTALWAGLGCMQAAQDAMNEVWNIPRVDQPSFVAKRLRALAALLIIGAVLVVSSATGQMLAYVTRHALAGRLATSVVAVVVNSVAYLLAFQVLSSRRHRWRALLPGAVVAGVGYTVLQLVGRWYVERTVNGAEDTYGTFAVVIGLLAWLYLLAQLSLFAAEINVVRELRLWPRSLRIETPTEADREVVRATAEMARVRRDTHIDVHFDTEAESQLTR